ncbi:MAG: hypothetical protein OFPI_32440 [Osedax symbiont Rs2]|nr:MAG: hypothetical protein OFPI_32440 [Osedax symbiont Rs2]
MSDKIPLLNVLHSHATTPTIIKKPKNKPVRKSSKFTNEHNFISADAYRGKIYTKKTTGYFQRLRKKFSFVLFAVFLLLPWLQINSAPAVLFDLQAQKFHVFGMTFWPQDAVFLVSMLVLAAFLLVAATLVIGRAWCGFSCPQTLWTFLFIWVEDKCEGDRNQRIKLDKQSWSWSKVARKASKHILWMLISIVTAYTFVGYFYQIMPLILETFSGQLHYLAVFWLMFFVLGTYLNAGWLREKVCLHMCPYARFQAVMYTKETLVVSYDQQRGERRGKRKTADDLSTKNLGDCVDCSICVQVCPVDIDIRDGLQYPCIDCGLCADACDTVMDKMGYPQGLIKFSNESGATSKTLFKSRKVIFLTITSLLCCLLFAYSVLDRDLLSIDVIRDRSGILYRVTDQGVENSYTVKVNNKGAQVSKFKLDIVADSAFEIIGQQLIQVPRGEVDTLTIRIRIKEQHVQRYKSSIKFVVKPIASNTNTEDTVMASQLSSFIAPL